MAGSGTAHLRRGDDILLSVEDLVVTYRTGRGEIRAVVGVSFDVRAGETVGLVGESGCGKSTTARAVMQLPRPTSGTVRFEDTELTTLEGEDLRRIRPHVQMIFQDPISALNPRKSVRQLVEQGLHIWRSSGDGGTVAARVDEILEAVGLPPATFGDRRPHQLSGGQCQRVAIGRALVLDPKLVICDEPVSALDVSVQAQIINLLEAMKARYGLTLLFIAHDLAVVKNVCDRVIVMYMGKICEVGSGDKLLTRPQHPYTQLLLESVPQPDPAHQLVPLAATGDVPSVVAPPSGCRFRTRCPRATSLCADVEPTIRPLGDDRFVACHHPGPDAVIERS